MNIQINLTEEEVQSMQHDLLDIEEWVAGAVKGKINNCKKRMFNEWMPKLRATGELIPPDDATLLNKITSNPEYKNRKARDKAEALVR